ncbi:MAG: hypothetical protein G8D61_03900 [gamma proteobacterium symbiont of Ctena orbiculata]|nr:hypothetical protein [Candidatus Thiodiazotropha taylori]MBT3058558.1 hypothetical protein [Candidatus Thiodiazotropha sp. (ex Lucina pensylvanica)]MBT3060803.1 hypothetical protein [Candidatus Thiodiazotropha sp. (ex Lucina pensylvanica)]MBV2095110.1 hypothetical protein [Candidatus Thiodiazotropha sp. (ex Codakia orbicularis)]PUB74226.1 MAG: hypothetical protein DBP03_10495 [gamma proteobacterium symbiont of Ctena orbiculata]
MDNTTAANHQNRDDKHQEQRLLTSSVQHNDHFCDGRKTMEKRYHRLIGSFAILLFACQSQAAIGDSNSEDWQQRRLMQPTPKELSREQGGHIMIYDGLTDRQVANAMDRYFNRIQSMMFTSIVVTDEEGLPKTDPATGELIIENDGCD